MARRKRLTDAGIARLRPEMREYTVWDSQVVGLGVRVRPSGSRTFVYHRKAADGVRKKSFGPAGLRKVEDVRRACLAAVSEAVAADERPREAAPLFRDFVAAALEDGLLRPLQTLHTKNLWRCPEAPIAAGVRPPASRSHRTGRAVAMVRDLQQNGARKRELGTRTAGADTQPRHVLRPYRGQSCAGHTVQSWPEAHPLPVPRGNRPPSPGAGPLRPWLRVAGAAGRHHPPAAADRMPQERDRPSPSGGGEGRPARTPGQQDRLYLSYPASRCHSATNVS